MSVTIAKNASYLLGALIGQKVLAFFYFTAIAVAFGVAKQGEYSFALAFTAMFAMLVDLGFTPTLIREVAKDKERGRQMLHTIIWGKLVLGLIAYFLAITVIILLGKYSVDVIRLVAVAAFVMILDSIHLTAYGYLRGRQNLRFEALGVFGGQIITVIVGSMAILPQLEASGYLPGTLFTQIMRNIPLILDKPIIWLMIAFAVGSAANITWSRYQLKRHAGIALFGRPLWGHLPAILREAWPFALAGIFTRIYASSDLVLLRQLKDEYAVGLYAVPYKITFAFQFVPLAIVAALYPAMSKLFAQDKEEVSRLFERTTFLLSLIVLPIAVGIYMLASAILTRIYGIEYAVGGAGALRLLMVSLVFIFLDFPIGSVLNASGRQEQQTTAMGAAVAVNIIANLLLIPPFGVVGAAVAALVGNATLLVIGFFFLTRAIAIPWGQIIIGWVRLGCAVFCMGIVIYVLRQVAINIFSIIFIAAVVYAVTLVVLRAVKLQEIRGLITQFSV